ncbi:MAG: 5-dehydro-4-deoxy-D-glucuronate isomerase [Leadbetterella sp.]
MQQRYCQSPEETKTMDSQALRGNFLMESLFEADQIHITYTHYDRVIFGGIMPTKEVQLGNYPELRADYFLERREMGVINLAGDGKITADGQTFDVRKLDCVYLGKGTRSVSFQSNDPKNPAKFFVMSTPAHHTYPNALMTKENASPVEMGALETANNRTIYKYIHLDGLRSCQLVMGLTVLKPGSVWNTMPTHVHDRRMEVYCYFDIPDNQIVMHFMGQPQETRHLVVKNEQAIISPPWSIHSGSGTTNYGFIWAMAGENQVFTDMDFVQMNDIR